MNKKFFFGNDKQKPKLFLKKGETAGFSCRFSFMNKRKYIKIISFLACLCVLLCAAFAVSAVKAHNYKLIASVSNERALGELCEQLDNLTTVLKKSCYLNSKNMLSDVSQKLSTSASCAKISLGQLTDENIETDEIYKFLSQVGDFTSAASKAEGKTVLSEKQRESLVSLYEYCESLSKALNEIRNGYYNSSVSFEKSLSNLSLDKAQESRLFSNSFSDIQQSVTDYPTLIYDGPFADAVLKREAVFVKNKDEITAEEAKKKAAKYLETQVSDLRRDSDEDGQIKLYCFSWGEKSVGITAQGGFLCYMTNPAYSAESTISEKEAVKRAKSYLSSIGYESMRESYYATYDGICTVNFAFSENGIIHYSDLIKVSVALDSGKIAAVDARGYLMNHREREIPERKISLKEAKKKIAENLSVLSFETALIPLENGKESLCYEFLCKDKKEQQVLIYINCLTGQEDNILLLLYSDGGVLTK